MTSRRTDELIELMSESVVDVYKNVKTNIYPLAYLSTTEHDKNYIAVKIPKNLTALACTFYLYNYHFTFLMHEKVLKGIKIYVYS